MAVNLVNLEAVSVAYGARMLLDGVSLGVVEPATGSASSAATAVARRRCCATLVKAEAPHSGRVTHTGGLRVGVLTQDVRVDERLTAHQAVLGDAAEHTWAGDARVREVLDGLGLHDVGLDSVVATMSGGERRRVALAALLVQEWDLLVLDEPTNHLDVEGVAWLAAHLKARSRDQAHLVVTHDRWFLDEVNTRTWEVHDGLVDAYDGGYSAYVLARAERDRIASDGRAEAAAAGAEGAGVAAPGPARPHHQAAVPDRRGERADRRRAAGARRHRAAALRDRAARQAGVRRRGPAPGLRRAACCSTT